MSPGSTSLISKVDIVRCMVSSVFLVSPWLQYLQWKRENSAGGRGITQGTVSA
ncbi:hypothetical protein KXV52_006496, partial [Aspergillus fumigatus]